MRKYVPVIILHAVAAFFTRSRKEVMYLLQKAKGKAKKRKLEITLKLYILNYFIARVELIVFIESWIACHGDNYN